VSNNKRKIKGVNNKIEINTTFMKNSKITIIGNNNKIHFGDMCYLANTDILISGDNNEVILGNKVYVNGGKICLEDSNNILKIGNRTTFSGDTHLAVTEGRSISIGDRCLFSSNVIFRTGDSHSIIDNEGNRINHAKDIFIGKHVWFTQNTTILKGVTINDDSIVATGSVVTKSFPQTNVILAGNPAKVIKENVNWDIERK
jgi:acetyltransferase-like isoleucine patch superfamily enzyme